MHVYNIMIVYNVCNRTVCIEITWLEVLFSHMYLQNHMATIFFEFTTPTAQFIPYQFYSDCEASALSFYKMHTVFSCLYIYHLSINMYMLVKGSLKKTIGQYSNIV